MGEIPNCRSETNYREYEELEILQQMLFGMPNEIMKGKFPRSVKKSQKCSGTMLGVIQKSGNS